MGAEKNFENTVKKFIENSGGWHVKFFANRMTKSGIPDILACINGYFVGIEVKAENGKPSDLQKYHRKKITESGGIAIVLYPADYELFKQLVNYLNIDNFDIACDFAHKINERSL